MQNTVLKQHKWMGLLMAQRKSNCKQEEATSTRHAFTESGASEPWEVV
jgi:hypothetical protein